MKQENNTLQDILEIVEFIRDNAVTKDEFRNAVTKDEFRNAVTKDEFYSGLESVKTELREEMQAIKNELMNHIDTFADLHQRLEAELIALTGKYQRLESYIQQIAKHVNLRLVDL